MELNCGTVIYVINQSLIKTNQNILNLNLINPKKSLVFLVKNTNLLDQTLK